MQATEIGNRKTRFERVCKGGTCGGNVTISCKDLDLSENSGNGTEKKKANKDKRVGFGLNENLPEGRKGMSASE